MDTRSISQTAIDGEVITLAPRGPEPLTPLYTVEEARRALAQLQALVSAYLIAGKRDGEGDYGHLPGVEKPVLFKSGAEKLCDIYGLAADYRVVARVEDWSGGFFHYEVKVRLCYRATGQLVATGLGSANSRETKWQRDEWWNEGGTPPTDQGWQRIKTKKGGWAWKRKTPNPNPADLANTLLKMAKKRALVDGVLGATRSSGLFTQDIEDVITGEAVEVDPAPASPAPPAPINPEQKDRLNDLRLQLGWPVQTFKLYLQEHHQVDTRDQLSSAQADEAIADLTARLGDKHS